MSSKQVTDREKSAEAVSAAGTTHADSIHQALSALFQAHLAPGETMPDFALMCRLFSRSLADTKAGMVKADEAHIAELGDDAPVREARDEIAAKLYSEIVDLREVLIGLFGVKTANAIISGGTPRDPVVLSRFAKDVADKLSQVQLPAPRVKGAKLDKQAIAISLLTQKTELDARLSDVARELREAQATQVAKDRAIGAYDELFAQVASALSGFLRLAGDAELAARVRPSTRRPGQTAEPSEVDDEPNATT